MSFYGSFALVTPAGLLQLLCQEQRSVVITARGDKSQACILLCEGLIIGGSCDAFQGPEAIYRFVTWRDGVFRVDPLAEQPTESEMAAPVEELLLEAARRRDEFALM
ncbi:DUF4388 domain-containing protein [Candidatus Gracilibacteria bacterium]|nr:DUF4388 domain-containing protein [Candidatus Gracilibacteria bacterium]